MCFYVLLCLFMYFYILLITCMPFKYNLCTNIYLCWRCHYFHFLNYVLGNISCQCVYVWTKLSGIKSSSLSLPHERTSSIYRKARKLKVSKENYFTWNQGNTEWFTWATGCSNKTICYLPESPWKLYIHFF